MLYCGFQISENRFLVESLRDKAKLLGYNVLCEF